MNQSASIHHWTVSREGKVDEITISGTEAEVWDAITRFPGFVSIGAGATLIDWFGLDDRRVLDEITIEEPSLEDLHDDEWDAIVSGLRPEHRDKFPRDDFDDAWVFLSEHPGDLVSRHIGINGMSGAILVDGDRAAVVVAEIDGDGLPYFEPLLSCAFAREPGGPAVFEGSMQFGTQASDVFVVQSGGDPEADLRLSWVEGDLEEMLSQAIAENDWTAAFARFDVGIPGCTTEERDGIAALDIMGERLWVDGRRVNVTRLRELLAGREPSFDVMSRALLDADSINGRLVYDVVRRLADPRSEGSWDDVDSVLRGLSRGSQ